MCSDHCRGIASLDSDAESLSQKRERATVASPSGDSTSQLGADGLVDGPQDPKVSIAMGENVKVPETRRSAYLVVLIASALSAADPAVCADESRCDGAKVSGQVKSQTRY